MRNDNGVYAPHSDKPWAEGNGFPVAHDPAPREGPLLPPPDGFLKTDAHGVILEVNNAATELFQCNRAFLLGKPLGLMVDEVSRPAVYKFLTRSDLFWEPRVLELRLGRPELKQHDVIAIVEAEGGGSGQPILFRWQLRDVTSLRRIERALRSQQQLLDGVIDTVQAIILVLDSAGRVLRSNPYLHEVSGYLPEELYRRPWYEKLVLPHDRLFAHGLVQEALHKGATEATVLALPVHEGGRRSVAWSARGLPEGVAGSVVLLGHDVTEIEKAQTESLRTARLAAIGQLSAGLAHEGRNALQRIQACLSMLSLRLGQGAPDVADLVSRAQMAQDDLSHLFEDILGYTVNPRVTPNTNDLRSVWREAWADLEVVRAKHHAELIEETAETDLTCEIDRFQIKRVFRNLFENALAAADPIRITVGCRPARLADHSAVRVSVHDDGPGFPPKVRERLFEPFQTTKTRGTGLGLAICRRLIEAHGGRIEAGRDGPCAEIVMTLPGRIP